ncbi:MAG: M1 family aminopeptidase [Bacteroidota bacterium]
MKSFNLFLMLFLLTAVVSHGQVQLPLKGSSYCSMKKSAGHALTDKPFNTATVAPHTFDVTKYTMNVDLYACYSPPYPKNFFGSVVITFLVDSTLNKIRLNADNVSLTIDSVRLSGVSFTHSSDTLRIQLDRNYAPGETANVKIYYHHNNVADNAFYVNTGTVFTDCEPEGARKWFPCWDHPSDKALFELTAKVKSTVKLGSNGMLADSSLNGDVLTYHWISNQNVATYLMVMTSKVNFQLNINYWHKLSNPADSIPLRYYFNLGEDPTPVSSILPAMTTWYSQNFIEHPFDKNGFATLNSDFAWGGMENQTLTSLCPNCWQESLAAHEFAHQWFGDMITCGTWADIWLNEGFATWTEAFWYESYGGYAAYKADIDGDANYYLSANAGWAISNPAWAVTTPPVNTLFDYSITYMKGACALHQLRYVLGDSMFFATMRAYSADSILKFHSATIQDFNAKVNQVTGANYDWFFNEWIFQPNHPVYQNSYNIKDMGSSTWKINFFAKQVQTNPPFFKMPLEILVHFTDGTDSTFRVMNDVNYQQYAWTFTKQPVYLQFDPNRQIVLKAGSTVVGLDEVSSDGATVLYQNCPNPVRATAQISYSIGQPEKVQLEITDMVGIVKIRIPAAMQTPGMHEVVVDCSKLTAGTYLYKLTAGTSVLFRKLVVVR